MNKKSLHIKVSEEVHDFLVSLKNAGINMSDFIENCIRERINKQNAKT